MNELDASPELKRIWKRIRKSAEEAQKRGVVARNNKRGERYRSGIEADIAFEPAKFDQGWILVHNEREVLSGGVVKLSGRKGRV